MPIINSALAQYLCSMSFFQSPQKPFLIAGPCSAESREQIMETAYALQHLPVKLFRAGIWKPRTRPGHFEGIGEPALAWLQEAKAATGIPMAIEVAEPSHVELALRYGIDVLWIGARTTVNPFQVQRLADALRDVKIPVMIKNPVNPDADLWLGAIERMERTGVSEVAAIHRGFSSYKAASVYRNTPNWPVPIELRRRRPELKIICDPSHISGRADKVAEVAQKAMDMDFDGLMIETHPVPAQALSDAAQQITPAALKELLHALVIRQEHPASDCSNELEHLRQLMDSLDAEVIDLLARRMEITERMGVVKKALGMTAYQPERWREIVTTRGGRAAALKMDEAFIIDLYEKIHHHSVKRQLQILQNGMEGL